MRDLEAENKLLLDLRKLSREKLARELHDGLTQMVATLAMRVNYTRRLFDSDQKAAVAELQKVEHLTRLTAREIRYMIFSLHPLQLESFGLRPALELLADKVKEIFNLQLHLSLDQYILDSIEPHKRRLIYLLIEEAIDFIRRKGETDELWLKIIPCEGEKVLLELTGPEKSMLQVKTIEDNRELDDLREHAKLVGGMVSVITDIENRDGLQILLPLSEIVPE